MASAEQPVWLVFYLVFGIAGFGLLGYVQVFLAEGKRFKDQPPSRKKLITCASLAQWPYMFFAVYGGFTLLSRWLA